MLPEYLREDLRPPQTIIDRAKEYWKLFGKGFINAINNVHNQKLIKKLGLALSTWEQIESASLQFYLDVIQNLKIPGIKKVTFIDSGYTKNHRKIIEADFPEGLISPEFFCSLTQMVMDKPCYFETPTVNQENQPRMDFLKLPDKEINPYTRQAEQIIHDVQLKEKINKFISDVTNGNRVEINYKRNSGAEEYAARLQKIIGSPWVKNQSDKQSVLLTLSWFKQLGPNALNELSTGLGIVKQSTGPSLV